MSAVIIQKDRKHTIGTGAYGAPHWLNAPDYRVLSGWHLPGYAFQKKRPAPQRRVVLMGGPRRTAPGVEFQSVAELQEVIDALTTAATKWAADEVFELSADIAEREHNGSRVDV